MDPVATGTVPRLSSVMGVRYRDVRRTGSALAVPATSPVAPA